MFTKRIHFNFDNEVGACLIMSPNLQPTTTYQLEIIVRPPFSLFVGAGRVTWKQFLLESAVTPTTSAGTHTNLDSFNTPCCFSLGVQGVTNSVKPLSQQSIRAMCILITNQK